jgi:hypothetical protein
MSTQLNQKSEFSSCTRELYLKVSRLKHITYTSVLHSYQSVNEISSRIDDMEKSLGELIENINGQSKPKGSGND